MKKWSLITLLIIALLIAVGIFMLSNYVYVQNYMNPSSQSITNNTNHNITVTINPSSINDTLLIPSNDYVINNINWSSYPHLQRGYVLTSYIAKANEIINHDFIEVQINTEVKSGNNETEIYNQLCGVAKEARNLYGPNSGINIYGTIGGVAYYHVEILPYDDKIYHNG